MGLIFQNCCFIFYEALLLAQHLEYTLCENEFFSEGDFLFLRGLLKAFLLLVLLVGRRVTMHKEVIRTN